MEDFVLGSRTLDRLPAIFTLTATQFRASGLSLEAVTNGGIPYWAGAIFLAVVVTLYVMSDGLRSVVWTDVIQGALMHLLLAVAMVILVFNQTGGFTNLMETVEEQQAGLLSNPGADGLFALPYLIPVLVFFAAAHFTMPQLQQRWMAARSHSTLKFIVILLPIGTGIIYICCFNIAMVGAATRPDYPAPEAIYPVMIVEVLPQRSSSTSTRATSRSRWLAGTQPCRPPSSASRSRRRQPAHPRARAPRAALHPVRRALHGAAGAVGGPRVPPLPRSSVRPMDPVTSRR